MCLHPLDGSLELGRCRKRLAYMSGVVLIDLLQIGIYTTNLEAVFRKSVGQELRGVTVDKIRDTDEICSADLVINEWDTKDICTGNRTDIECASGRSVTCSPVTMMIALSLAYSPAGLLT